MKVAEVLNVDVAINLSSIIVSELPLKSTTTLPVLGIMRELVNTII